MEKIILWLLAQSPSLPVFLIFLILILAIYSVIKIDSIRKFFSLKMWGKDKKQKRACQDCILIILAKTEKYNQEKQEIVGNILDTQMTFAAQKIEAFYLKMVRSYSKDMTDARKGKEPDYDLESKEYRIYEETLSNALHLVKKEVRRSFKENGFHDKVDKDFIDYIRKQTDTLMSIAQTYMKDRYPAHNMIVSLEDRFEKLDYNEIYDMVYDVYLNAKNIRIKALNDLSKLKEEFSVDIQNFSKI